MERFAVRWYAMWAFGKFLRECPDDPTTIRFRAAIAELREAVAELRTVT